MQTNGGGGAVPSLSWANEAQGILLTEGRMQKILDVGQADAKDLGFEAAPCKIFCIRGRPMRADAKSFELCAVRASCPLA